VYPIPIMHSQGNSVSEVCTKAFSNVIPLTTG
jgi:hypothetical protein